MKSKLITQNNGKESMIWSQEFRVEDLNSFSKKTLSQVLDIKITAIGDDFLQGTMPVDERTHQPAGILHGGASVALAETLGSVASYLVIDREKFICVGLEINANHVRSVKSGTVTGIAKPVHLGGKTHIWNIEIVNEEGKLVCISRLTMAILPK